MGGTFLERLHEKDNPRMVYQSISDAASLATWYPDTPGKDSSFRHLGHDVAGRL